MEMKSEKRGGGRKGLCPLTPPKGQGPLESLLFLNRDPGGIIEQDRISIVSYRELSVSASLIIFSMFNVGEG